ncbi:dickkopf-related protein 4 [Erethizon dorsatum]
MRGSGAALLALLGLGGLCAPLAALVLDFNNIKGAADAQGARKVGAGGGGKPGLKHHWESHVFRVAVEYAPQVEVEITLLIAAEETLTEATQPANRSTVAVAVADTPGRGPALRERVALRRGRACPGVRRRVVCGARRVQTHCRGGSPCASDEDCGPRKVCLAPRGEQPFCASCRGPRRPCQRGALCCPGARCANDVCAPVEDASPVLESRIDEPDDLDATGPTEHRVENKPKRKPNTKKSQGSKGQEGESCLRTSDCGPGLCCARHFWTKICKPVLLEGQLCSRKGRKDTVQAPEIFQRCDCGPGLACRSRGSQQHARLRVCQEVQKGANISAQ